MGVNHRKTSPASEGEEALVSAGSSRILWVEHRAAGDVIPKMNPKEVGFYNNSMYSLYFSFVCFCFQNGLYLFSFSHLRVSWAKVSLCSPGWTPTHSNLSASATQVLGLQA